MGAIKGFTTLAPMKVDKTREFIMSQRMLKRRRKGVEGNETFLTRVDHYKLPFTSFTAARPRQVWTVT